MRNALLLALLPAIFALTACGHKKHARIAPPPPPPSAMPPPATTPPALPRANPPATAPGIGETETGLASWYGYPYHGRHAADGEIYDMETLVAAHRTLPFNTWVRVVNLSNDKVVEVRIIDRGPFIEGRIIDLSRAAARNIDLIRPGVGPVRIEVMREPTSAPATAPPVTSARTAPARTTPAPAALVPVDTARAVSDPAVSPATPPHTTSAPAALAPATTARAVPAARIPASAAAATAPRGSFAVQVGIFFDRPSAERVRADMAARYGSARIVRREGDREMWRVLVGSESTEGAATAVSDRIRQESGERNAFVVRLD